MSEDQHAPDTDDHEDDLYETLDIRVDPKQSPLRLDKFLHDRLPKVSRNRIQNAIKAGSVLVDGEGIKANHKIKPGQHISVVVPKPPGDGDGLRPQDIPLDIRYEDDDVLIVYKPPGMVVHPGVGNPDGTLVNALAFHFDKLPVMQGNDPNRVGLVHRIDKDTSGLLVIAKNDFTMTHLAKQFFDHSIDRTYQAICWGEPEPAAGSVDKNVGRDPRHRTNYTTFSEGEDGKNAVTHYRTIEPLYYVSLIELKLETGRTHQIRVHMQSIGHPLFNDERYGGDRIVKGTVYSKYRSFVDNTLAMIPRQALHAKSLGFIHPRSGERLFFDSDLPDDFQVVLERWRSYLSQRTMKDTLE